MGINRQFRVLGESTVMTSHTLPRSEDDVRTDRVVRIHMLTLHKPSLLVTPNGQDHQIDLLEFFSNVMNEVSKGGIPCKIDLPFGIASILPSISAYCFLTKMNT